jgi:acetylornithine deacetylase
MITAKMPYLEEIASRLVAADTVSHLSCVPVLEALADDLDRFGFRVELQRYAGESAPQANLLAVAGPPEPGGLALSGHVDVVPFADQPGWTRDPLRLESQGDRVFGRGTSDMKIFLAQAMEAARRLAGVPLERPLALLFTAEEEIGCLGSAQLVPALPDLLADVPTPARVWIGEPTSGRVFRAHKGIVAFSVTVRGEGGHSSVPEAGVNAIAVAAQVVVAIGEIQAALRAHPRAAFARLYPEAPYTTVNLGTIRGGTASNIIAESCELLLSYRPLPDEEPLALYRRIRERLEEGTFRDWASPGRRARVDIGTPRQAPGLLCPSGTSLGAALCAQLGVQEGGGAPYCTDGGRFAEAGMEVLICGPGELEQAHQPDESASRTAFEAGPEHLLGVIRALCGSPARG